MGAYQQRYKSFPIQDNEHFFVVCRHVERNALRSGLVKRAEQWRWGALWHWLHNPALQPPLLSRWPLPRLPGWVERVNTPLSEPELASVRLSAQRGRPLGDPDWVDSIASRLNLESTMRPRRRQQFHFQSSKEADPFGFPDIGFTIITQRYSATLAQNGLSLQACFPLPFCSCDLRLV